MPLRTTTNSNNIPTLFYTFRFTLPHISDSTAAPRYRLAATISALSPYLSRTSTRTPYSSNRSTTYAYPPFATSTITHIPSTSTEFRYTPATSKPRTI